MLFFQAINSCLLLANHIRYSICHSILSNRIIITTIRNRGKLYRTSLSFNNHFMLFYTIFDLYRLHHITKPHIPTQAQNQTNANNNDDNTIYNFFFSIVPWSHLLDCAPYTYYPTNSVFWKQYSNKRDGTKDTSILVEYNIYIPLYVHNAFATKYDYVVFVPFVRLFVFFFFLFLLLSHKLLYA